MKIGNLEFKEYAAKKPLSVSARGEFLTASEIAGEPVLGLGSLFTLKLDQQLKLALARYALEPDFTLGIIGVGLLSKDEVIEHLTQQTDFGCLALRAEMGYCNELIAELAGGVIPAAWPPIPVNPLPPNPTGGTSKGASG